MSLELFATFDHQSYIAWLIALLKYVESLPSSRVWKGGGGGGGGLDPESRANFS